MIYYKYNIVVQTDHNRYHPGELLTNKELNKEKYDKPKTIKVKVPAKSIYCCSSIRYAAYGVKIIGLDKKYEPLGEAVLNILQDLMLYNSSCYIKISLDNLLKQLEVLIK